jgi:hypothetical protein
MFQNDGGQTVIHKRMSFLSVAALSLALVLIAAIVSATGITIYGMRLIDHKTNDLGGLLKETVQALPEIRRALPPALADAVDDERRPDYRTELKFAVRLSQDQGGDYDRAIVEVENCGDRVVTLLSMRIIGLDKDGEPVVERNTWAATPLQADHDWRGPLLPKETRRFAVPCWTDRRVAKIVHEVTDLRVWRTGGPTQSAKADAPAVVAAPAVAKPAGAVPEDSPDDDGNDDDDTE